MRETPKCLPKKTEIIAKAAKGTGSFAWEVTKPSTIRPCPGRPLRRSAWLNAALFKRTGRPEPAIAPHIAYNAVVLTLQA